MRNRYYEGPISNHFDGTRFYHPGLPPADKSLADLLRWTLQGKRTPWPDIVPGTSGLRPPERVNGLRITAIGHSSLLIQVAGINLLVDPVWAERASPLRWAGPQRRNAPAVAFDDLPPIDVVLVTHNHYDHLDCDAVHRLWHSHRPRIITPLGNDTIIRKAAGQVAVEIGDWWDSFSLANDIQASIVPAYHWSARGLGDRRMALWGGFMLQTPFGPIYCAGDTAYRDGKIFQEIRERCGSPEVAILPIGAYEPRWFMESQHANPEEAVRIALDVGARQMLGVHWGTFPLTDEPYDEPEIRLNRAAAQEPAGLGIKALHPGDVWEP